jgi:hypothetical protein
VASGFVQNGCMEVVPAQAAECLGACREAIDSIACLKCILTGLWCRRYLMSSVVLVCFVERFE